MLRQNRWNVFLCLQALYISKLLFTTVACLSRQYLRIVKRSFIHKLKFLIAPIRFSCFINLNVLYLCRFFLGIVALKCCLKRTENESDFCHVLGRHRRSEKWPLFFLEFLMGVTYTNSFTHWSFHFVIFFSEFTIIDTLVFEIRQWIKVTIHIH